MPSSLLKLSLQSLQSVEDSGHCRQSIESKILYTLKLRRETVGFSDVQTTVDTVVLLNVPSLHTHKLQATKNKCFFMNILSPVFVFLVCFSLWYDSQFNIMSISPFVV
jgi:hypothetical protein